MKFRRELNETRGKRVPGYVILYGNAFDDSDISPEERIWKCVKDLSYGYVENNVNLILSTPVNCSPPPRRF